MTINKAMIKDLEDTYRKRLPDELKRYLLVEYADEPFPYEFSDRIFTRTSGIISMLMKLVNWMSL